MPPGLAEESESEDKSDNDEPAARTGGRGHRLPSRGQQDDAYDDTVHRNNGRHLHDGIPAADNEAMCWLYDQVVAHGYSLFCPPNGAGPFFSPWNQVDLIFEKSGQPLYWVLEFQIGAQT